MNTYIHICFSIISDDDSTPIEKDEWLAFMRSNMKEVLEGDVESLTQQNIVMPTKLFRISI